MHGVSDSLTQLTIKGLFHLYMYDIKYCHLKSTVWHGKCIGSVCVNTYILHCEHHGWISSMDWHGAEPSKNGTCHSTEF